MPAPSLLTFCANRRALSHSCSHAPTFIETFDLRTGELITRTFRERNCQETIKEKFESHQTSAPVIAQINIIEESINNEENEIYNSSSDSRSQVWHNLTQCDSPHLSRSLTPPPPFSSQLVRQASHSHSLALASIPKNPSLNRLDILCSTHPTLTVMRETFSEEPLPSQMRGGWSVEGHTVSRLSQPATINELLDIAPIASVLWSIILDYSETIYKLSPPHECCQEIPVCEWENKHSTQPLKLMSDWMKHVCETPSLTQTLLDHSAFTMFNSNGSGWDRRQLLKLSENNEKQNNFNDKGSILHPVNENKLILTRASIEAYQAYIKPNVLNGYTYSRPPFVFPPVAGYLCQLNVEIDSEAVELIKQEQANELSSLPSSSANQLEGFGVSPTQISEISSANTSSPLTRSASPAGSPSLSSAAVSNIIDEELLHQSFNLGSPRRSSLPPNHKTDNLSNDANKLISSSNSSIPSRLLFQSTWSIGDRYYRHGTKSLLSSFLGIDVPFSSCPWPNISKIEFAMSFTLNDQSPQPCVILHK